MTTKGKYWILAVDEVDVGLITKLGLEKRRFEVGVFACRRVRRSLITLTKKPGPRKDEFASVSVTSQVTDKIAFKQENSLTHFAAVDFVKPCQKSLAHSVSISAWSISLICH